MRDERSFQNKKVLFLPACEGVSHAGRMLLVARALRERFAGAIEFAGNGPYSRIFPDAGFAFHELNGEFSLRQARRFQDKRRWSPMELRTIFRRGIDSLRRVIDSEVTLIQELKPDLLVWDGRFTVLISAEVAGIPSVSVINPLLLPNSAVPRAIPRRGFVFVKYPWLLGLTRLPGPIGEELATMLWGGLFRGGLRYLNRIREGYGLRTFLSLGAFLHSLPAVILPEAEVIAPLTNPPAGFHHVGPLVWQPEIGLPDAVSALREIVYVTMGSTGSPDVFKPLVASLVDRPSLPTVVTTGGLIDRRELEPLPDHLHLYDFLPGAELARRARLVICHGAPATMAQALSFGVPIIGIPFNIPQELALDRIVSLGAARKCYPTEVTKERIDRLIDEVLGRPKYREAAMRLSPHIRLTDGPSRAADVILGVLGRGEKSESEYES